MAYFTECDGVEGGELEGPIVMGPRGAMKALKRHRIISGSGDNGAWIGAALLACFGHVINGEFNLAVATWGVATFSGWAVLVLGGRRTV